MNTIKTIFIQVFNFIKFIITWVLLILKFIFNPIYQLIERSKHKFAIYSCLFLFLIGWGLIVWFQHEIKMFYFDLKIKVQERNLSLVKEEMEEKNKEIENIKQVLVNKISDNILTKKQYCITETKLNYLNVFKKNNVYVSSEDLKALDIKIETEECSIEMIKNKEIEQAKQSILALFNTVSTTTGDNTIINESVISKEVDNKLSVEIKNEEELDQKYNYLKLDDGVDSEEYVAKSQNKIKAVFCSFGHGLSMKDGKSPDSWYVVKKSDYENQDHWKKIGELIDKYGFDYMKDSYHKADMLTERQLVELINSTACPLLKQKLEPKGIKVYIIGDGMNPNTLWGKIDEINKISEENGYDAKNSVAFELHSNSVSNPDKSGIEVFYSSKKMKNNGLQGRDFALTLLESVSKEHIKHKGEANSVYVVKPDTSSKHAYLGFTTLTKPNSLVLEYGFKKNFYDVSQMVEHHKEIAEAISNGVVNFVD